MKSRRPKNDCDCWECRCFGKPLRQTPLDVWQIFALITLIFMAAVCFAAFVKG